MNKQKKKGDSPPSMPEFGPLEGQQAYMLTVFIHWLEQMKQRGIIAEVQIQAIRADYLGKCGEKYLEQDPFHPMLQNVNGRFRAEWSFDHVSYRVYRNTTIVGMFTNFAEFRPLDGFTFDIDDADLLELRREVFRVLHG